MKFKSEAWYAGGLFVAWATAATTPAAGAQTDAATGWAAVAGCAQQVTERARHSCLDQVLRDAGLLTAEMTARQERSNFGLGNTATPAPPAPPVAPVAAVPKAAPAAPAAVAAPPVPAPAVAAPRAPEPKPERLEVEVASVATTPDHRKLIITTSEGAVWRQTEDLEILPLPVAGDRMTLRKGALGSYFCRFGKSVTFRCMRSR
jgi:hypothetical protein